jgi:hypothetical protein
MSDLPYSGANTFTDQDCTSATAKYCPSGDCVEWEDNSGKHGKCTVYCSWLQSMPSAGSACTSFATCRYFKGANVCVPNILNLCGTSTSTSGSTSGSTTSGSTTGGTTGGTSTSGSTSGSTTGGTTGGTSTSGSTTGSTTGGSCKSSDAPCSDDNECCSGWCQIDKCD